MVSPTLLWSLYDISIGECRDNDAQALVNWPVSVAHFSEGVCDRGEPWLRK